MKAIKTKLSDTLVKSLITKVTKMEKFVLEQSPEVCKEIIREGYIDNTLLLTLSLPLSINGIYQLNCILSPSWEPTNARAFAAVLSVVGGVVAIILTYCLVSDLLTIKNCPRLYVLRGLRRLLKSSCDE